MVRLKRPAKVWEPEELINLAVPLEEGPPVDHLCEDGAHGPHVDGAGVLG